MNSESYKRPLEETWRLNDRQKAFYDSLKEEALANHRPIPLLFPPGYNASNKMGIEVDNDINDRLRMLDNETEDERTKREAIERPQHEKIIQGLNEYSTKQETRMNQIKMFASMSPPQYPIYIYVNDIYLKDDKQGRWEETRDFARGDYSNNVFKTFYKRYYLLDNNDNFIYVNSHQNALTQVKNQLSKPNSILQESYNKDKGTNMYILRISSNNTNSKLVQNILPPLEEKFNCWQVLVTNAKPSTFSNFRMSFRKIGRGGKTKNRNSNKKMKSIKRKSIRKIKTVKRKTNRKK